MSKQNETQVNFIEFSKANKLDTAITVVYKILWFESLSGAKKAT